MAKRQKRQTDLFSELCDVIERDWHDQHPGSEGPPLEDDGVYHTSSESRRLAMRIMQRLEDRGFVRVAVGA